MGRQRGLRPARAGIVVYVFFRRGQPKGCLYIPVSKFPACLQAPAEGKTRRFIAPEVRGHPPPHLCGINLLCLFNELQCWGGGSRLLAGGDGVFQRTFQQPHHPVCAATEGASVFLGSRRRSRTSAPRGPFVVGSASSFCFRAPVFTCDSFPPRQKL